MLPWSVEVVNPDMKVNDITSCLNHVNIFHSVGIPNSLPAARDEQELEDKTKAWSKLGDRTRSPVRSSGPTNRNAKKCNKYIALLCETSCTSRPQYYNVEIMEGTEMTASDVGMRETN